MGVVYTKDINVNRPTDLGPSPWQLSALLPITIVFGKNGCGKSRLLRNLRDTAPDTIHYVAPERSGELNYNANLLHAQLEGKLRQGEATRNLVGNYREQIVSRIQGYFTTRGSVRGTTVSGDPAELERFLATLLPDFQVDLKGAKNPPYELRRSSGAATVGNIDQLSSGEAQILTVGLDVLTIAAIWDLEGRETRIVLVDEPDAHIHPDLQVRFADFLVAVAERFKLQIVIATHSTTLLAGVAQFSGLKGGVIYLDRTRSAFKTEPLPRRREIGRQVLLDAHRRSLGSRRRQRPNAPAGADAGIGGTHRPPRSERRGERRVSAFLLLQGGMHMKECIYQSYRLEWRGIDIEIRYCREWLASTDEYAVAHFEVESACRSPLPITETGFVSHFTDPLLVLEFGGPAAFVESWLEAEGKSSVWKSAEESLRQYTLF